MAKTEISYYSGNGIHGIEHRFPDGYGIVITSGGFQWPFVSSGTPAYYAVCSGHAKADQPEISLRKACK